MNLNQVREEFEKCGPIKSLRHTVKTGNAIQIMEAEAKLKYALEIWLMCWPIAWKEAIEYDNKPFPGRN
jgi:hypothetical protein